MKSQEAGNQNQLELYDYSAIADAIVNRMQQDKRPEATFGAAMAEWRKTGATKRVDCRNEDWHAKLMSSLDDLKESEVTPAKVMDLLDGLKASLSPATINAVRAKGRQVIRHAQLRGIWHAANPFDLVPMCKTPKPKHHKITLDEVRAFLPHLQRHRFREGVFGLKLGPRAGEERGLRKQDIDFEKGTITIQRSNSRDTTKTGQERTIPIPDELLPILKEAVADSSSEFVFPKRTGGQQSEKTNLTARLRAAYVAGGCIDYWEAMCRRPKCGYREKVKQKGEGECPKCNYKLSFYGRAPLVRWHDLRHAAATLLTEAGCDPVVIRAALGHAGVDTTERVYLHLSIEHMRTELNKLKLFSGQPGRTPGMGPRMLINLMPRPTRSQHRMISVEEARAFLPHCGERRFREAAVSLILALRACEIRALRRRDVSIKNRTITIRQTHETPRVEPVRVLPIPDQLMPVFKKALRESPSDELVFPAANGKPQLWNTKLSETLRAAYVRAGIVTHWEGFCVKAGCGHHENVSEKGQHKCPRCGQHLQYAGKAPTVRWEDLRYSSAKLHRDAGCHPDVLRALLGYVSPTRPSQFVMRVELSRLKLFPE